MALKPKMIRIVFAMLFFAVGGSAPVFAQDNSAEPRDRLPKLLSHSKRTFSIYQGDKINLQVKAEGEGLLYRWVRNYKTICRKSECEFNSGRWGVGRQSLTVVTYNRFGSRAVTFLIRVLARSGDKPKDTVTPEMITAQDTETVTNDDYFIRALVGIGYAYKNKDVKVIGKVARLLTWEEKLRTHAKGVVHFGVKDQEELILMPSGNALLATSESGKRAAILRRGTMRARQISPARPLWSVLVDDWVQVDGDKKADLIIERKNATQVSVTALRGNARVFYRKTVDQPLNEGLAVVVPVGTTVDIEQGYDPAPARKPLYKDNDSILRQTSPQYFLRSKASKGRRKGMFLSPNIRGHKEKSLDESMIDANKFLDDEDYFSALENLLPVYGKGANNYAYNIAVARAYRNLQLFRPALRFLRNAKKIDTEAGEPDFEIGLMYIDAKSWAKAEKFLLKARSKNYSNRQLVNYYLGVAQYNQNKKLAAKVAFEYSLWEAPNKDVKQSSVDFLQSLGADQVLGAVGMLGFGYDSNVYRWGKGERTESYETETGMFYRAFGSLFYQPFNDLDGFFKFAFDVDKKGYLDAGLADVETLSQKLYLDYKVNFGLDDNFKPGFTLRFQPFVELFSIGEERSADNYGLEGAIGSESLGFEPHVLLGYTFMLDPLPGRDDLLDPILMEPVAPSDRSAIIIYYGLGLNFVDSPSFEMDMVAKYKSVERRSELVQTDDFSEISVVLPTLTKLGPDVKLKFDPGYIQRTFPNSTEDRADSVIFTDLGVAYYYTPTFYNDLRAHYRNQSSNVDLSAYDQYHAGLYFTLEL